ncbi:MAG: ABC transporter substrate-binding protein [Nitratireductor sp.]
MRNFYKIIVFSLLTLSLSLSHAFATDLKIGLSLPLSGDRKNFGEQFLIGAQLAVQLQTAHKVDLFVVDDGCDESLGELAATDLAERQPHIVTGYLCNETSYIAANILRVSNTPILIAGAQSERLTKDRTRQEWQLWRLSPSDKEEAEIAAQILSHKWSNEPYAIVDDGTVLGRTLSDIFKAKMEDQNLSAHFVDTFRPTQSTQARLVRRLARAGVKNVFVGGGAEDIALIAQNAQQLNIPLQVVGTNSLSVLPYLNEENRPPNGLLAVLRRDSTLIKEEEMNANAALKELTTTLSTRNITPEDYIFRGFAAMQLSLKAASSGNVSEIKNALNSQNFSTILGDVKFSENGENTLSPYALYQWQDNAFLKLN